jgi:hypothetical protein
MMNVSLKTILGWLVAIVVVLVVMPTTQASIHNVLQQKENQIRILYKNHRLFQARTPERVSLRHY